MHDVYSFMTIPNDNTTLLNLLEKNYDEAFFMTVVMQYKCYCVYTSFKVLCIFKKVGEKLLNDGSIAPSGLPVCRKKGLKGSGSIGAP